jgi:ABC-type transport system involved in multi-copper enzyme maturation permease subunit
MRTVYLLTLRQLAGRWRLLLLTALAALPVAITWMMLSSSDAPRVVDFEKIVLLTMLAGSIAPLVVLAMAAPAFANEIEDRTLANLVHSPLPRWRITVAKWAASVSLAGPFIAASACATAWIAFLGDGQATLAVTLSAIVGVAVYAAAFTWLGLVTTQAIGVGLVYIVLWEGFLAQFLAGVRGLSIKFHAIALMHALDARRFADADHVGGGGAATAVALALVSGFLVLATRRLRTMDVP